MSAGTLVVVGGGILGTMHALEGLRHGYRVTHLERDPTPAGASVRNFGLVWVSGRAPGAELTRARRARELWGAIGAQVPATGFRAAGSLTCARTDGELAVIEDVAGRPDANERGFVLLKAEQARAREPALGGDVRGALWCPHDAILEPRLVLTALRERLSADDNYCWRPGCEVVEFDAHAVRDATGEWHGGDLVVCCPGATPGGVIADALSSAPLRRVRLQMLETAPSSLRLEHALADGDSLRYYPAYAGDTRDALAPQDAIARRLGAQLLLVQRRSGSLTIGDTHDYAEPFSFDLDAAADAHLLEVAAALFGTRPPPVARRWEGVYVETTDPDALYHRAKLAPGVVAVTGPGGRGMTLAPVIAEETFA